MGLHHSRLEDESLQGTYTPKEEDADLNEGVDFTKRMGRRLSIKEKIERSMSIVPATVVATEALLNDRKETPQKHKREGLTNFEAALQLFKVTVGSGILFMPKAFQEVGVCQGIVLTSIIAAVSIAVYVCVVRASQYFSRKHSVPSCSYSDTARLALSKWPVLRPYAHWGQYTVSLLIIICSYSTAIVYIVMTAKTLQENLEGLGLQLSPRVFIALQLPFHLLTNSSKSLKRITPITICALVFLWSGIGLTTYFITGDLISNGPQPVECWRSYTHIPSYFSIVIFAFTSITMLTAIENNMRNPDKFVGCPSVVSVVVIVVSILYVSYGLLGYFTYGIYTLGPVTSNFKPSDKVAFVLKLCIATGLFLSCPVILYAPLSIVTEAVTQWVPFRRKKLAQIIARCSQIIVLIAIPLIIKDLMGLLELVGAFLTILQFVFPLMLDWLTFWEERNCFENILLSTRNFLLLGMGTFFVSVGFYFGIMHVTE